MARQKRQRKSGITTIAWAEARQAALANKGRKRRRLKTKPGRVHGKIVTVPVESYRALQAVEAARVAREACERAVASGDYPSIKRAMFKLDQPGGVAYFRTQGWLD